METLMNLFDPIYEPPRYEDHAKPGEAKRDSCEAEPILYNSDTPNEFHVKVDSKEALYGFTYRYNGNYEPTKEQYDRILKMLRERGSVIDYVFEDRAKSGRPTRLHIHGIIKFNKKAPRFSSLMWFGCKSKFELLYNVEGWRSYITKNQCKK